jgi:hypothetical protein
VGTLPFSILIVVGSALFSVLSLVAIRKAGKREVLRRHNELAGNVLAVVGTLNAVLLGLVIVEAQSRFQQARTNEATESSLIADTRLYAEYLPEPTRTAVDRHVERYVKLVREQEWDSPPQRQPNKQAVREFHALWKLACSFTPANSKEQSLQTSMLTALSQSFDLRRFRITTGRHGLPSILWAVLVSCSIITVLCTCFLAAESLAMHALLVTLLSITLSMGIVVVWVLGNPYTGDWKIRPEQFMRISTTGYPITSDSDPFKESPKDASQSLKERIESLKEERSEPLKEERSESLREEKAESQKEQHTN